jgi:hypothetical protein
MWTVCAATWRSWRAENAACSVPIQVELALAAGVIDHECKPVAGCRRAQSDFAFVLCCERTALCAQSSRAALRRPLDIGHERPCSDCGRRALRFGPSCRLRMWFERLPAISCCGASHGVRRGSAAQLHAKTPPPFRHGSFELHDRASRRHSASSLANRAPAERASLASPSSALFTARRARHPRARRFRPIQASQRSPPGAPDFFSAGFASRTYRSHQSNISATVSSTDSRAR